MKRLLTFCFTVALLALATTATPAFEPTDASEVALYNARLTPGPRSVEFGRGVVVFNEKLRCVVLTAEPDVDFGADLETLRAGVRRDFCADFAFEKKSAAEFLAELKEKGDASDDALRFAQKLTEDAEFFQKKNAYRCLALRDPSFASDASAKELAERRNDSAGTLLIAVSDFAGLRDSFKTLRQLSETFGVSATTEDSRRFIPEVEIDDAPLLEFRGMHLCWFPETEISEIERSIRLAAYYKLNYIVLEFWGVFPFDASPALCWDEFHTTKDDVRNLVAIGKELGVELIPQMNLFGHAPAARGSSGKHTILDFHPEMEPLFTPDGWTWNVCNPATRELLTKCVLELYETFDRPAFFHIGCDEAYSAGTSFIERRDGGYLDALADWIVYFHDLLKERNCRIMMWHDMLIEASDFKGYTTGGLAKTRGLIDKLPKDILICDWQYGAPKEGETWPTTTYFLDKGFDVLACPWENLDGIRSLAKNVAEKNAFGLLCTTWHTLYGDKLRKEFPVAAQAAWGTKYQGSNPFGFPFDRHLRQALQNAVYKDYRTNGVNDWQVPKETNVPY